MMRYGSLFSGYGGLDLGVQSVLGGTTAWHCEYDKAPSTILDHHWPDVPNLGDITKVDWATVEPVDVLTGGSPCQDLSGAGKRAGLSEGTRSNLWVQMREAIAALRPQLVVWENVRGALSAPATSEMEPCPGCVGGPDDGPVLRALGRVVGDLAQLGYVGGWTGLRAADVGAPHGRFRVFLFATPRDTKGHDLWHDRIAGSGGHGGAQIAAGSADRDAALTLLPTPAVNDMGEGKTVDHWDAWTAKMQVTHGNGNGHGKSLAIEAQRLLPTPDAYSSDHGGTQHPDKRRAGGHQPTIADVAEHILLPTPTTRDSKGHNQRGDDTCLTGALLPTPRATDGTKGGPNQRGSSGDLMLPSAVHLLPTPQAADGNGGGRMGSEGHAMPLPGAVLQLPWGDYAAAIARWESVLGRPAPPPTRKDWQKWEQRKRRRLSSKLPVGMRGSVRFLIDGPSPRLSVAFVEWMQGLPAGHVTDVPGLSRNEMLKCLGNGVVWQQAAAATRWFLAHTAQERAS